MFHVEPFVPGAPAMALPRQRLARSVGNVLSGCLDGAGSATGRVDCATDFNGGHGLGGTAASSPV